MEFGISHGLLVRGPGFHIFTYKISKVWTFACYCFYFFVTHFNPKEQAMISSYIILTSTVHHGDGRKPSINENFG
jgi:hypothetical protein